ncbi:MAG TPA: Shedu immune nuclease family protein [Solirubrobacterales bacterium]|nr:Shedu immune nuclease family protein [Solirubrobacterales bacterium]
MDRDFEWDKPLKRRRGAPTNLLGIDVFFDFDWLEVVGHSQAQFHFGQCLARRVCKECPEGKVPALLLTDRDDFNREASDDSEFYVVVVNLPRYLKLATADASAAYFGDSISAGLTRMSQIEAVAEMSSSEVRAFLDLKLTPKRVAEWAAGNAGRMKALRKVVGVGGGDTEDPAPVSDIIAALRRLDELGADEVGEFKTLLADPDKRGLVDFINQNDLLPGDLMRSVDYRRRCKAVDELEEMLTKNLTEAPWQRWFEENDWVLGTEFVRLLEERPIDVKHIADYLMEAYDGFLDLVEIKRPEGQLRFWADTKDHGNYIPHMELIKAITQASRYILEVEREANSVKFLERIGGVKAIKPRCVLIYGRSVEWNAEQREAYRVLNASYYNLTIMTFDHVLDRAKRIVALTAETSDN